MLSTYCSDMTLTTLPKIRDKDGTNYLHSWFTGLGATSLSYVIHWAIFQLGTGVVALWVILCSASRVFPAKLLTLLHVTGVRLATSHQCLCTVCVCVFLHDPWMLECNTPNCSHLSIVCNKDSRLWYLHFGTSRKKCRRKRQVYTI